MTVSLSTVFLMFFFNGLHRNIQDLTEGYPQLTLADTLAQNHDVAIIDNLATGRRVNIEHLLDHPG